MRQNHLDLVREVLDRQVVDANNVPCGKVDDLEVEGVHKLKVTAILIGSGAASERLPELAKSISQRLFGRHTVRVPWSEVHVITHQIKLRSTARELRIDERHGPVYRFISKLPGAWKK